MEIIILAGAETELFRAWERYEQWEPERGDRFHQAVELSLKQLAANPESGPRYSPNLRRFLVRRFRHGIFYQVLANRIIVVAVLDLRQSQEAIDRRLGL